MGRIRSAESVLERFPVNVDKDKGWATFIELELQAHHKLSPDQQQVVRNEFFSGEKNRALSIRACLAQYVIFDLKAAIDPKHEEPPEFQLEVANSEKLLPLLFN